MLKSNEVLRMTEIYPQFSHLLQKTEGTPVRLGRSTTPVIVLVPWAHYVTWRLALYRGGQVTLVEHEKKISAAIKLFLSYDHRLDPLLNADPQNICVVTVKVHGEAVGAVVAYSDWQQVASHQIIPMSQGEQTEEEQSDRVFTVVTASRHLSQFASEQEQ